MSLLPPTLLSDLQFSHHGPARPLIEAQTQLKHKKGWKAFFEEPIMLIAFVLLGRNLEQRAKIKATSDMTGLLSLLPSKARLLVNNEKTEVDELNCRQILDEVINIQLMVSW
ncbi:copper-transporting ATPase PAA1, chloroplastic-like isoform X2 [Arachis stenosperma]|uniref:copper-transporting ATPase PAA1, chloroplastic-like isoform X2 n=1 Tax=Arachis stenosperma TaxID=217475 RepID=UPI0025AC3E78|nr:copper-transporting ATPase PAA1, chloroplastic-like isoform X2 [Arachis stenosperma]